MIQQGGSAHDTAGRVSTGYSRGVDTGYSREGQHMIQQGGSAHDTAGRVST